MPLPLLLPCSQSQNQTRRFFGGRQPLCGIGVLSLMVRTSRPAVASARTADSRPAPGPLTFTSTCATRFLGLVGRRQRSLLRGERRAFARSAESQRPRTRPRQHVAHRVRDGDDGVVERGLDVHQPVGTTFFSFFLKRLLLCRLLPVLLPCDCPFLVSLYVLADAFFLLATVPRRGPLRVRALVCVRWPRTGKPRRWRKPAVGAHLDQPLDVHRELPCAGRLRPSLPLPGSWRMRFTSSSVRSATFLSGFTPARWHSALAARPPDAVNVGEPDFGPLLRR